MALSYRKLSYDEYKKAILSLLNDFSKQSKTRLLLAIEVCEELPSDDRLYRMEQSLDTALWEFDEAIELGFNKWKDKHLVDRSNAIIYHEQNSDECSYDCEVCKLAFRWKS
tara:strand:- start:725 stop:1057 length:333 start_codon:yes stop_codon:yes gene_type:complete